MVISLWTLILLLCGVRQSVSSNPVPSLGFVQLKFTEEPTDETVAENAPTTLHCAVSSSGGVGGAQPQIRWYKDGSLLELDEKRHRVHTNGSLYITSVHETRTGPTDEGLYQCLATLQEVGAIISRPARLGITYSIPTFEEQPRNLTLSSGQTAFFPCSVSSRSHPKVVWLKNGAPLRLDAVRMLQLPSGALEIDALQNSDEGAYQCQVTTNDKVRVSSVGMLKISSSSSEESKRVSAPSFIAQPSQMISSAGATVTLDCAANGSPRPVITWLKDGASIDMSLLDSRYRKVGVGSLQIENVEEGDAGSYMCRAENKEDSLDASATLTVQVPPTFRKKPQSKAVKEKEDALFECEVYGQPEPTVEWFKNGEALVHTGYFQLVNGHNLKILGSVKNDRGIYQCVASNAAGTTQTSAQLLVLDKDDLLSPPSLSLTSLTGSLSNAKDAPSSPEGLTARVVTANIISLSWKPPKQNADGIITYTVFYKAEGSARERVQNTTQHKMDEVIVKNLKPATKYSFRVVAVDEHHGMGESSEFITVETNPDSANNVLGPPQNVKVVATSVSTILVSYEPPSQVRGRILYYEVYYQEMGASSLAHEEQKTTSRTTQAVLDHLNKYTEYNIWVNAVAQNGTGVASAEVSARTFSDIPADTPQNVTLDSSASNSLVVRWEAPPPDQQNGVITGYKIRYKQRGRKGDIITTDGNRRMYVINDLEKGATYFVKIAALTVNGTGPSTEWISTDSYRTDLDENQVPGQPTNLRAKAASRSITIGWLPPRDNNIMIRGYTVGWGAGIPDVYTKVLEGKQRIFTIDNLRKCFIMSKEQVLAYKEILVSFTNN